MAKGESIKFEIDGQEIIKKLLETLPQSVNDKVQADLHRAGAKIVKQEIESAAPDGDNDKKSVNKIANNVIIKKGKGKSDMLIGFARRAYQVVFYEKGTKVRQTQGKGKYKKSANRGTMSRKPFVSGAHERAYPKVVKFLADNYLKIVSKSIKKQARKANKK